MITPELQKMRAELVAAWKCDMGECRRCKCWPVKLTDDRTMCLVCRAELDEKGRKEKEPADE